MIALVGLLSCVYVISIACLACTPLNSLLMDIVLLAVSPLYSFEEAQLELIRDKATDNKKIFDFIFIWFVIGSWWYVVVTENSLQRFT